MRKLVYMLAVSLLMMGGAQAAIVYQDTFNNDGLATNIGIGGGAVNKTISQHSWADDGNATMIYGGTSYLSRALFYSANSFQNNDGLRLTVNYSISSIASNVENELSFGLISDDTDLSTFTGYNPFSQTASVYSLGLELTRDNLALRGLVFSNGSSVSLIDAYSFAAGTGTAVIEIAAGGAWTYSINGIEQGSGTISGFDLSKSYRFAAYGRDDFSTKSINSVTIESLTSSAVSEWTGAVDRNWNKDGNWGSNLVPGSVGGEVALLDGAVIDIAVATPIENSNSYSVVLQDEAQLKISKNMYRIVDMMLGASAGLGGGHVTQAADVRIGDDLRIGDHASASSDSSYSVFNGDLNVIDELYVDQGTLLVSSLYPSVTAGQMTLTENAHLKFRFNKYGASPIVVSNALTLVDGATLEIDISDYTIGGNKIELIQFGSISGTFDPADVTIVGLSGGTLTYESNRLILTITDEVQEPSSILWFSAKANGLEVNTGRIIRDLTSDVLTYTQTTDGDDYLYTMTWDGSDIDGDGAADTISIDLRVEGFSGSNYTYSTNGSSSSVTLGSSAAVTSGWGWGIGSDSDLDAGESLRFSVENVSVSASGYTATVDGFLDVSFDEVNGYSHRIIIGEGTGLDSFVDNSGADYALEEVMQPTVTSAGNGTAGGLYVSSVGLRVSLTNPSNPNPVWDANDYSMYPVGPQMVDDYEAETNFTNYPEFSWDTVPRWAELSSTITDAQAQTLAANTDIMWMGSSASAASLKQYNPNIKNLYYINNSISFDYITNRDPSYNHDDWDSFTLDENGTRVYDLIRDFRVYNHGHPELRDWWVGLCASKIALSEFDGVMIDKATNLSATHRQLRAEAPETLIIGNSLRNAQEGGNRRVMGTFSGSYLESWADPYDGSPITQTSADARAVSVQLMREAALKGKILMPALQDRVSDTMLDLGETEFLAAIRARVTLPLAYYLIVAEKYSYFRYQPDQNASKWPEYVWDPTDYVDELTRPIGAPLGPPVKNGYVYTRSFEHLDVWLDVESNTAKLEWHPKAHWSLNEGSGTVASDSSGNNYDGTITDGTWVTGVGGYALDFNGSTSKVTLPAAAFSEVSDKVSIAMWVYGDTTQPRNDSVFYATDASGNKALNIHLPWSNSTVFWDAGNSGAAYDRISKTATASDFMGQWNHWVFTKSATTGEMKIYLNGSLWHSETGKVQAMSGITAASIGGDSLIYDGMIDDVQLYNVALNDVEVAALYDETLAANVPVATALSTTLSEDGSTSISLAGSDPNGNSLTYTVVTSPANGTLSGTLPNLTYTPDADFYGTDSFTYYVDDGAMDSATVTVSITVTAVNDAAPVATAQTITLAEDGSTSVTLAASDIDGDSLTYAVASAPAHGSLSGTAPDLTYTPNADFYGSDSFTYIANDGTVDSAAATVSITVNGVDDTPVADDKDVSLFENESLVITLSGSDVDGDSLSYTVETVPANGILSGTAPTLTYTPNTHFNGLDSFTYTVNDGFGDSAVATVAITIHPSMTPSTRYVEMTAIGTAGDSDFFILETAKDTLVDTAELTVGSPSSTSNDRRSFVKFDMSGVFAHGGDVQAATFRIYFNDLWGDNGLLAYQYGGAKLYALTAAFDPASATTDYDQLTGVSLGSLDLSGGTGYVEFDVSALVQGWQADPSTYYGFVIQGSEGFSNTGKSFDSSTGSNPPQLVVNVSNDAPMADDQSVSVNEDDSVAILLSGSDVDGDSLGYTVETMPTNGILSGTVPNLTYSPNANFYGVDSFIYTVNDGIVDSAVATVAITINPSITPSTSYVEMTAIGTASDSDFFIRQTAKNTLVDNSQLVVGSLSGATDNRRSFVKFDLSGLFTHGENVQSATFRIYYNDLWGDSGLSSYRYGGAKLYALTAAFDPTSATTDYDQLTGTSQGNLDLSGGTGYVDIDVTALLQAWLADPSTYHGFAIQGSEGFSNTGKSFDSSAGANPPQLLLQVFNDAPVADDQNLSVDEDNSVAITLIGSDVDGDSLDYTVETMPTNGILSGTAPALTYTPNANFNGADSFTYTVNDGLLDSAVATVSLTVSSVNDVPVFGADPITGADGMQNSAYAGSLSASDVDGNSLSYSKASGPTWLTVASNGALSGTPLVDDIGANSWTVAVSDGNGGSDQAVLNITVLVDPNPAVRVTEYYLTTGDFSGTTATVTLDQNLADDYYILVRGSRDGDALSEPDNNYARVTAVPSGTGELAASGAANQIALGRYAADFDWEGVVTVVECVNSASPAGFKLLDIVETSMTGTSGTDISTAWSDISQVLLFGSYRGGGATLEAASTSRNQSSSVFARLNPSGTNTLNWSRDAAGESLLDAVMTTFVVEWGSEWTVQHVNVVGNNGGGGADAVGEYTTASISSVARDNTWVWATGTRADSGIGDNAEACLVTLGDGVSQNTTETSVAVGSEYTDAYDFDVYVLTHPSIAVDYRFVADGNNHVLDLAVTVDTASAGARFGWSYNGVNGTGTWHPRSLFWARYTSDNEITISRGFDGQAFPAWVQGIDLSGLNQ